MAALARRLPDTSAIEATFGDQLPATLGATLGATFGDPTLAPGAQLGTASDLAEAAGESPEDFLLLGGTGRNDPARLTPLVEPDVLNEEFGHLGLNFPKPTRRRVAEILAEGKRQELIRNDILARGPQGFLAGSARLGVGFVRAALDPINIAAAFIPNIGAARFAGIAARLGPTTARLARGVVEGAVGNAAVEPLVFGLSRQQQLDYTAADAIVNIAFGGLIGGGLHVGLGRLGDFMAARTPETREAALRTAVAQMAEGRRVDVEAVIRAEQEQLAFAFDEVNARPLGPADDPLVRLNPEGLAEVILERGPVIERGGEFVVTGGEIRRIAGTRRGFGLVKVIIKHGPRSDKPDALKVTREDVTALPRVLRELEPAERFGDPDGDQFTQVYRVKRDGPGDGPGDGQAVEYVISRFTRTDGLDHVVSIIRPAGKFGPEQFSRPRPEGGAPTPESPVGQVRSDGDTAAGAFNRERQGREPADPNIGRSALPNNERLADRARREDAPERDATADFEAQGRLFEDAEAPEARLGEKQADEPDAALQAAQAELDFAAQEIEALRAAGALGKAAERQIDELAEIDAKTQDFAKGARAGALCRGRQP